MFVDVKNIFWSTRLAFLNQMSAVFVEVSGANAN
jgi:hypothetical protein